jgi:hypothetical protein
LYDSHREFKQLHKNQKKKTSRISDAYLDYSPGWMAKVWALFKKFICPCKSNESWIRDAEIRKEQRKRVEKLIEGQLYEETKIIDDRLKDLTEKHEEEI